MPYKSIQLAFSITPKLIYTSESNPAFSGYSYTTQDFNGGESNVVFTTGAGSANRLKNEMDSMKMSEGYSQRDRNQDNISSEQFKSERAEKNSKKQDLDSNIEVFNEGKKYAKNSEADNNLIEHQTNFQQVSFVNPYPALGENLLKLHLPVFPRYQISSNVIQDQYYPYNPYTRLELPLHNFDFYNPGPLFYQAATVIPDTNSKSASTTVENTKASVEPHIAKSLQINATNSESSTVKSNKIESRISQESTTNGIEQASSSQSSISAYKFESTIKSEKVKEEISTSKTAETSQSSIEQTTADNKASSTELASTEASPEKSNIATK